MKVCINCVYFNTCGNTNRTEPCNGRQTKSQRKKLAQNLLTDLRGTFPKRNYAYVSEMLDNGFTMESIGIMRAEHLLETCNKEEGDMAYAW